jgi:Bacterial Ig-like domain (DUF1927).
VARAHVGPDAWREVLFVERDWKTMWGRWFSGAYDETGIDVKLAKAGSDPAVYGTSVSALKTATTAQPVRIFGANLPVSLKPEDIGIGQGVKVARMVSSRPEELAIEVDVAAAAPIGVRDVAVAGVVKPAALVVYDKIDGIKVLPQAGMARVAATCFRSSCSSSRRSASTTVRTASRHR